MLVNSLPLAGALELQFIPFGEVTILVPPLWETATNSLSSCDQHTLYQPAFGSVNRVQFIPSGEIIAAGLNRATETNSPSSPDQHTLHQLKESSADLLPVQVIPLGEVITLVVPIAVPVQATATNIPSSLDQHTLTQ